MGKQKTDDDELKKKQMLIDSFNGIIDKELIPKLLIMPYDALEKTLYPKEEKKVFERSDQKIVEIIKGSRKEPQKKSAEWKEKSYFRYILYALTGRDKDGLTPFEQGFKSDKTLTTKSDEQIKNQIQRARQARKDISKWTFGR